MAFTKIFNTKRYPQIVVMKRQDSQGAPEIRFYFEGEGYGVCEFGIGFMDDDNAQARLDQAFKAERGALTNWLTQLPPADSATLTREISSMPFKTLNYMDLLNGQYIDKMTSSPLDPADKRTGIY